MAAHETPTAPGTPRTILVLGGGPAAFRLVRALAERSGPADRIRVLMDEPYDPYDRVALEQLFAEPDKDLTLGDGSLWNEPAIELLTNTRAARVDRDRRVVTDQGGTEHPYDELVFATGSRAAVIPIPGSQHAHVFRTVDDVRTMVSEAARLQERLGRRPRAVVVACWGSRRPRACSAWERTP